MDVDGVSVFKPWGGSRRGKWRGSGINGWNKNGKINGRLRVTIDEA